MRCSCTVVTRSSAVAPTQSDRSSELSGKFAAALSAVVIASSICSPAATAESKLAEQVADAVERTSKGQSTVSPDISICTASWYLNPGRMDSSQIRLVISKAF